MLECEVEKRALEVCGDDVEVASRQPCTEVRQGAAEVIQGAELPLDDVSGFVSEEGKLPLLAQQREFGLHIDLLARAHHAANHGVEKKTFVHFHALEAPYAVQSL